MPNIQIISDVHSRWNKVSIDPKAQLILAIGDLSENNDGIEWLKRFNLPALYILGNHEYYGHDLLTRKQELVTAAEGSKVIVLDNRTVVSGSLRILCTTLWSDQHGMHPLIMAHAMRVMNDYRNISSKDWYRNEKNQHRYQKIRVDFENLYPDFKNLFPKTPDKLNPLICILLHQESMEYIRAELSKPWSGTTLVATHHAPSHQSLHWAGYYTDPSPSQIDAHFAWRRKIHKLAAYTSDLDYLFLHHKVDVWLHGHLHEGIRYRLYGSIVAGNPTGYNDSQNLLYTPSLTLNSQQDIKKISDRVWLKNLHDSLANQNTLLRFLAAEYINDTRHIHNLDNLISFIKLYNQSIELLLKQRTADCPKPNFLVDLIDINKFIAIDPTASAHLSEPTKRVLISTLMAQINKNITATQSYLEYSEVRSKSHSPLYLPSTDPLVHYE